MNPPRLAYVLAALLAAAAVLAAACGKDAQGSSSNSTASSSQSVTLHLGYFPNITHSQAIVGIANGTFAKDLGANVKLQTKTFNAGPDEVQALFAGSIDIAYVGPNPAVTGYINSKGEALRVIAGATSGGALLVIRPGAGINSPTDLAGKRLATPQLGNTQDVALRNYLAAHGLKPKEDGGNVTILPEANADTLTLFKKGDIDGAWVPEPWASRLVNEAGGKVFVDERSLWPNNQFATTIVVVRKAFLNDHPHVVEAFLKAHVETTRYIQENPAAAENIVNDAIHKLTGQALSDTVITSAWSHMQVTYDPIASSITSSAEAAYHLGFLKSQPDLAAMYDLGPLNTVLGNLGLDQVSN